VALGFRGKALKNIFLTSLLLFVIATNSPEKVERLEEKG